MAKVLRESDFNWPTEAELRRSNEEALRKVARETGAKRIVELEHEARMASLVHGQPAMARGVSNRDAPHSRAALRKARAAEATTAPAKERAVKRKAERASRAAPKADDTRKITVLNKAFTFGAEGTARNMSWLACKSSKTVAEYAAKGGALKYLPRWAAAGAIKLG